MHNVVRSILKITMLVAIFLTPISAQETKENASKYLYGIAAWYGDQFDGQTTASGAKYSPQSLTAGHRSLPFGTRVEIENLSNGKKVQVLINDRGPFEKNRIVNVSKQAAEILEFTSEGTTFVKITILELGTSLTSPLGLPEPPIGKEIPQNYQINTPEEPSNNAPALTKKTSQDDYSFLNDSDLFADLDNEFDFMDDSLDSEFVNKDSQLKAQGLTTNFADNNPGVDPIGFDRNIQDILIDDPLSNITIGVEDEFVASPNPPREILKTAPSHITPEEQGLLNNNTYDDPFSDLFNDTSEPYSFQEEVGSSLVTPTIPRSPSANNVSGDDNLPVIINTNTRPVTNIVTNTPSIPEEDMNEFYNDFYYYPEDATPPVVQESITNNNYYPPNPPVVQERVTNYPPNPPVTQENMTNNTYYPPNPTTNGQVTPQVSQGFTPQKLGNHYVIQLGAFSKQKNALTLYEQLRSSGFNAYITDVKVKGQNLMRVRVGYFRTVDDAIQTSIRLKEAHGIDNRIIQVDYEETK
ncbi:MAG: septal ring lytic transglycosylase RlpA family protein [Brevinema sp.]